MDCLLNIILTSTNEDIVFNLKDMNIGLFVLFFTVYYLLIGVLGYLWMFFVWVPPDRKERKWSVYLLVWGHRARLGLAGALALLTIEALGAYTVP